MEILKNINLGKILFVSAKLILLVFNFTKAIIYYYYYNKRDNKYNNSIFIYCYYYIVLVVLVLTEVYFRNTFTLYITLMLTSLGDTI